MSVEKSSAFLLDTEMIRRNNNFQRKAKKKDLFLTKWLISQRDFRLKSRQILLRDVAPNATEREIISERDSATARKINFYRNSLGRSFVWWKKPAECESTSYTRFPNRLRLQLPKVLGFQRAASQRSHGFVRGQKSKALLALGKSRPLMCEALSHLDCKVLQSSCGHSQPRVQTN